MKRLVKIAALLCLAAGCSLLLFARVAQTIYQWEADTEMQGFSERSSDRRQQASAGIYDDMYWAMAAYNDELYRTGQEDLSDPFSYEQVAFSLMEYGFEEEMIGYLEIPRMDLALPVYLGASGENMMRGAVHLTQTSLPIGGESTNAVIGAHRGMRTADMFRDIEKLEPGDRVLLTNPYETLQYQVLEIKVIHPYDVHEILIQEGRDMLTLLTCHPYGQNTHRYIVYCERL